jgi:hypothetical protein
VGAACARGWSDHCGHFRSLGHQQSSAGAAGAVRS